MFRNPETRRKLAILAITLGVVFIIGVLWSVVSGETEWWTLILILPAAAIMRRLSGLAARPVKQQSTRNDTRGNQKSEP